MWCKSLKVLNPDEALKKANMHDLKPCYGKCKLCVWKYNGGRSKWNRWNRRRRGGQV